MYEKTCIYEFTTGIFIYDILYSKEINNNDTI